MIRAAEACPLCGEGSEVFFASRLGWSVRSDVKALPIAALVLRCRACSHLFKPAARVLEASDYRGYRRLYAGRSSGDKMDFTRGPATRSDVLVAFLKRRGLLKSAARVLDYGCHRGAFLSRLTRGGHAGFDVSEKYRRLIEGLGFDYYTPDSPPPAERCELLTLVHVFEHMGSVSDDMRQGLAALAPGGSVLVQSPDPATQPTDLYIADHRHHFGAAALTRAFALLGLCPRGAPRRLLAGEWTALFRRSRRPCASPRAGARDGHEGIRRVLARGEERLLALRRRGGPFVVYGAGNLGALAAAVLGRSVRAFVDDNPDWRGERRGRLRVAGPGSLRRGDTVVVAVPPHAAEAVASRCLKRGLPVEVLYAPLSGGRA